MAFSGTKLLTEGRLKAFEALSKSRFFMGERCCPIRTNKQTRFDPFGIVFFCEEDATVVIIGKSIPKWFVEG